MKTLRIASMFLLASLGACGQQLVEFAVTTTGDMPASIADLATVSVSDLAMVSDLATVPDLVARDAAVDLATMPDLVTSPDMSFPPSPYAPCAAMLASAQTFAVLGGQTVTNTGPTAIIGGNLGVSPGNAITGIPIGMPIGGTTHAGDAVAAQAQSDLTNTYTCMQAAVCHVVMTGMDLGGLTLKPDVYCFASSAAQVQGSTLILDAQGNPNAIWIFQVMSTLTILDNAHVHVINGGKDCNVFWQVGSSATLGKNTRVVGTLLALASITLNTGASVSGRVLARNGSVTMDTNDIDVGNCSKGAAPAPGDGGAMASDGGTPDGGTPDGGAPDGSFDAKPNG